MRGAFTVKLTRLWLLGLSDQGEAGNIPGREGVQVTNRKRFYVCISGNLAKEVSEETDPNLQGVSNFL